MRRFFKGPHGIELELNSLDETPIISRGVYCAKYEDVITTPVLKVKSIHNIPYRLSDEQRKWVESMRTEIEAFNKQYHPNNDSHAVVDQKVGPDIVCPTCQAHFNRHKPGCPSEP